MNFFKQKFTTILLAVALLIGAVLTVNFGLKTQAANLNSGSFSIVAPSDPLFSDLNIAPGFSNAKSIQVTNTSDEAKDFSIALSNLSGELKDVLMIKAEIGGTLIWDKSLANIAIIPNNELVVNVQGHETTNILFTAYLPFSVGNAYQGKSVSFDFVMGASTIELQDRPVEPIIPPDNPLLNIGGTTARSFSGFRGNTGFALNSDVSEIAPPIAQNQLPGEVLGTNSETKGESAESLIICYWWLILLIIFALFLFFYGWIFKKRELIFDWVWPIIGGVLLYIAHIILHRYYEPSKWCPYFIWIQLAMLLIYYILYTYLKNRTQEEKK